jgi:anionic cell wall polymer biosynthesis LytR-Cps2A-Psr (LCP) family protein
MKFSKQTKTSLQSFIITFFAALVLFALVAWLLFNTISARLTVDKNENPDSENIPVSSVPDDPDTTLPDSEDDVIEGESFTLLVAGYNVTGDSLDAMVIVDVDKENEKLVLYPVNPDANVYVGYGSAGSVNVRLGDLCRYKDMSYIADKVSALTSVSVDYYVSFTADAFVNAVNSLNKNKAYSYTVPKDMIHTYSNDSELEKYNIDFKRGDKLTSGIDIYNVLRYEGDSSSDRMARQASIARDMIKVLVTSQIKDKSIKSVISTFTSLVKTIKDCKTNISLESFITEGFELLSSVNDFTFETSNKFKTATLNFK